MYGYADEEYFMGNLNEFKNDDYEWFIFINDDVIQMVDNKTDMKNISVWTNVININTQLIDDNVINEI